MAGDEAVSRRALLCALAAATVMTGAACSAPEGSPAGQTRSSAPEPTPSTTAPEASQSSAPSTAPSTATTGAGPLGDAGPDVVSGPTDRPFVALTFHGAGDPALALRVLSVAAAASAGVTVFAVGQWLDAHPELGRAVVAAGHDLGNHTWSHQEMTTLTPDQAITEVRRGADAVTRAVGAAGLLFRPSGTATSTPTIRAAAAAGGYRRCVSYNVDPADYTDPGADLVRSRVRATVGRGSIVSLHLGHPGTVEALPGILADLSDRHLNAVPVTRMLAGPS